MSSLRATAKEFEPRGWASQSSPVDIPNLPDDLYEDGLNNLSGLEVRGRWGCGLGGTRPGVTPVGVGPRGSDPRPRQPAFPVRQRLLGAGFGGRGRGGRARSAGGCPPTGLLAPWGLGGGQLPVSLLFQGSDRQGL